MMNKKRFIPLVVFACAVSGIFSYKYLLSIDKNATQNSAQVVQQTKEYIATFDPRAYELAGTDFFNTRYSPLRLNKPLDSINTTNDYDFEYLKEVSDRVSKVDRRKALKAIFNKVTAGSKTETDKQLAVLKFLHKTAFDNPWMQPMYPNTKAVLDPIVLLELGEMRCGAMARVGVDLYEAAGYKTRLVQAVAHTTAEVFYENDWHLFEAYLHSGGETIMVNNRIPSVAELSKTPYLIDSIPSRLKIRASLPPEITRHGSIQYPSYFFFYKQAYLEKKLEPYLYYKTATEEQAKSSTLYGWDYYETVVQEERELSDFVIKYEPGPPRFVSVDIHGDIASITWKESADKDADLLGYRIFVSTKSRGWNYNHFIGDKAVKKYWHGGWRPTMYDKLFQEPPKDVGIITTRNTAVEINLPSGETRYVTVMPFDKHGETVGRRLYNMSEELVLSH